MTRITTEPRTQAVINIPVVLAATICALIVSSVSRGELRGDWTDKKAAKVSTLTEFKSPVDIADKYDARIRGFIYPPKTGDYIFAVNCDDQSDLFLSTTKNPKNKKLIARCPDWAEPDNFKKFPQQKSNPLHLIAGNTYYIEAVHKENSGGDHLTVAWMVPGNSNLTVIPGSHLSPYPAGRRGQIGHEIWLEHEAPPIKGTPKVTVTSRNDPTKPIPGGVRWFWRDHQKNLQKTKANNFDICFLGDSITQGWPDDLLKQYFDSYRPANFGIGGDRAENVLFRLQNGELADTTPKLIVVLLGINNLGMGNTPGEAALGIALVLRKLRTKIPEAKILLLGVFPSKQAENDAKIRQINDYLAKMDDGKIIRFLNINAQFVAKDGKLRHDLFRDAVHLNRNGYIIWAESIKATVEALMK
jgi:lysophospholipase L1-like esterase